VIRDINPSEVAVIELHTEQRPPGKISIASNEVESSPTGSGHVELGIVFN
jgi:hypothetical protein